MIYSKYTSTEALVGWIAGGAMLFAILLNYATLPRALSPIEISAQPTCVQERMRTALDAPWRGDKPLVLLDLRAAEAACSASGVIDVQRATIDAGLPGSSPAHHTPQGLQ